MFLTPIRKNLGEEEHLAIWKVIKMNKTKILHIAPAYQIKGGGIFEVVENLSSVQNEEKEMFVDILCLETNSEKKYHNKVIYNLLPTNVWQIRLIYLTLKFMWTNLRTYDAIHIHGAWSFQFIFITPFLYFLRCKCVYQPHGLLGPECMKKSRFIKKIAWFTYQKLFMKYCKNIICCSTKERYELLDVCKNPEKIKIIPNGIAKDFFTKKSNIPIRKQRFLFFSQITPIKNLESFFKAISILKNNDLFNVYIDIFGYGPEVYVEGLKQLAIELSIEDNIIFKGAIAREDRVEIYDSYEYFILPSLSENFGIAVLEALSRKCKVFVSTRTPWAEYQHKNLILLDPDEISIYSCLKRYLIEQEYESVVDSKIKLSLADFDWNNISTKFSSLYFNR